MPWSRKSRDIPVNKNPTRCNSTQIFTAKSLYMFRVSRYPSSGVLKTVTAASGTGHNTGIARSKRDGTRAETRFGLSAKRTSPFKSAGVSVQSATGSRGERIGGQQLYRPCSDVQCKTTGYPLHSHLSPSFPLPASPCAIRF